jgi:adenylate cyclase
MNRRARPKTYGFGRLLTGILFLLLLSSMALIAVVSSVFTRVSIQELSNRIVQQTLARVELRIEELLQQAMTHNEQTRRLLEGQQLAVTDFKALGAFFAHSLEGLKDLTYLGFGLETNGDYVFAERLQDDSIRVREYVIGAAGQRVIQDWRWRGPVRELVKVTPWDGYDPRQRPFYQQAIIARTNAWTETYQFWRGSERGTVPGVTLATPFYGSDGKLVGVLNADFDLAALCKFLDAVRQGMAGYAFVVERRRDGGRKLIAHPDPNVLPAETNSGPNALTELRDQRAAAFMRTVLANEQSLRRVLGGTSVKFEADDQQFFGGARRLMLPGQPTWAIGVVIPVNDVMAGVYRNDRRAFWLGLICLALTAAITVAVARRVSEPLRALTREAQAIGRLELRANSATVSRVTEVATLANSMADMKSSLRSFQKFVPADVVRDIVTSATEARLGGQRATLTLFFSDIRDFTAMAEQMTPEALVSHVGQYLGEMSEVIQRAGGTVDKFIGDGIMAFWGAPRENQHHASHACRAALECQRCLAGLRQAWLQSGRPPLHARIGLHTGSVIVGNIGSESRLNYTALGDGVNLTSRLEGLNKFYGTEILLSSTCVDAAGQSIITRPVDQVAVKGRLEGFVVHELLGLPEDGNERIQRIVRLTTEAFGLFLQGDFRAAQAGYQELAAAYPEDAVAALMEKRCAEFMSRPQPTEWETTFRMKDK